MEPSTQKNKIIPVLVVLIILLVVIFAYFAHRRAQILRYVDENGAKSCSLEAKQCPDGSSVYQVGPTCTYSACVTSPTPNDTRLRVGQTGVVDDLTISLNSFVSDNRCPTDVQCIVKGSAKFSITLTNKNNEAKTLTIDEDKAITFAGHTISIASVFPEKVSTVSIESSQYRVTFHVGKDLATTTTATTAVTPTPKTVPTTNIKSGGLITSPFTLKGEVRGWYFEASFPVELLDGNGKSIFAGPAQAQGDWMSEKPVPYSATLTFKEPATATGTLVLKKDNPSGDPKFDESLRIPVRFK
jgi:hypothetical protein